MVRTCVATLAWLPAWACSGDGMLGRPVDVPYTDAECAYGEPNDSAQAAARITPADTGPAALCASGDRDFYRFTVPELTEVEIAVAFTTDDGDDLDLRLSDTSGGILAQARGSGSGEALLCPGTLPTCPALAAGDYILEVVPATGGGLNRYTIAITFRAM